MIELIIENYFITLILIGFVAASIFLAGLYLILRGSDIVQSPVVEAENKIEPRVDAVQLQAIVTTTVEKSEKKAAAITITSHDFTAIAGEDVLATQLDLARAYIETGRKKLAKKILMHVVEQGSPAQQDEAQRLIGFI